MARMLQIKLSNFDFICLNNFIQGSHEETNS